MNKVDFSAQKRKTALRSSIKPMRGLLNGWGREIGHSTMTLLGDCDPESRSTSKTGV